MTAQFNIQDARSSRGSQRRNIAAAVSMAAFAVVGTAGMAWSALSMALDSPLELRKASDSMASHVSGPQGQEAIEGFAEGTRVQAATTKPALPSAPIVIEGPILSTRGEAALAAAAQDGLFSPSSSLADGETVPVGVASPVSESTPRPAPRPEAQVPPVVQASTIVVTTQQPVETATSEEESRLERLWTTGVFR